ncbi:MAG: serine/threonine-protein kinase [Verrucomicrobiota bacterium]
MSQTYLSSLRGYEFSPMHPSEVSQQLPGFEVDGILGVGGMGAVYRGWQKSLHRHVAIKLLPEELEAVDGLAERFESEARAMARLSHGSIAGVFDINRTEEGRSYFVMEYVDGGTLHDLMNDRELKPEEIVHIMTQVCDGLQYAHDRDVIHRDIKPNNILITQEGKVKLVDFGLAHVGEAVSPGSMAGTPRYMAPELFEDDAAVDGRADIDILNIKLEPSIGTPNILS